MKIKRDYLLLRLQQISSGLAEREILEQSASYVFNEGKIITFNDEVICRVNCDTGITGAVHAKPLLSLLNKWSEDDLDLSTKPGMLVVTGKRGRSCIRMDQNVLLPFDKVPEPEEEEEWEALPDDFVEAVETVKGSVSQDDLYFNLTCVHITPRHIEASDGYQVTRYFLETGFDENCLIVGKTVKDLGRMGMTHVSHNDNWIYFGNADLSIGYRRWVQHFPDVEDAIMADGVATTLPGGLAEAVEKAQIFSTEGGSSDHVMVQLKQGKLRIKGSGDHGWYEEVRKIAYTGTPLSFTISPKLLTETTRRTNECLLSNDHLKFDAGKFIFVACLGTIDEKTPTPKKEDPS